MSAYLVARITVKNPEKWGLYTQRAKETIAKAGGKVLLKDENPEVLAGEEEVKPFVVVLLEFSSKERIQSWYLSDEYQELVSLRDSGAKVQFVSVGGTDQ